MKSLRQLTPRMQPFLRCVMCLVWWVTLTSGFRRLKTCLTFPWYYTSDRGGVGEGLVQVRWIRSSFALSSEGFLFVCRQQGRSMRVSTVQPINPWRNHRTTRQCMPCLLKGVLPMGRSSYFVELEDGFFFLPFWFSCDEFLVDSLRKHM